MAMPAYAVAKNIRLSFATAVGTSLVVNTVNADGSPLVLTAEVFQDYQWADPDGTGSPATLPPKAWVNLVWLEEMAGRGGSSIVQADVRVRTGAQVDPQRDPFGVQVDDVADALEARFRGMRANGTLRGAQTLYDFSDPTDPVPTDVCLWIQNTSISGGWGVPLERRRIPTDDGYQRITMRFQVRTKMDSLPGPFVDP